MQSSSVLLYMLFQVIRCNPISFGIIWNVLFSTFFLDRKHISVNLVGLGWKTCDKNCQVILNQLLLKYKYTLWKAMWFPLAHVFDTIYSKLSSVCTARRDIKQARQQTTATNQIIYKVLYLLCKLLNASDNRNSESKQS